MENKMSEESKRKQHCTACRNHDLKERKTSHKCPFEKCECLLCSLTQTSRTIMRHQQRLWRHLKEKSTMVEQHSKKQVCDKCRNHNVLVSKRNHKGSCPHEVCKCKLCDLTDKRRDIMRHQQRVRRSGTTAVTSPTHRDAYEYVQKTKKELSVRYGEIDGIEGYSSDEAVSQEENGSFSQIEKHYIDRHRSEEEIASPIVDASPASTSSARGLGAKPRTLAAPIMKEEMQNPVAPLEPYMFKLRDENSYQLQPENSKTLSSQHFVKEEIVSIDTSDDLHMQRGLPNNRTRYVVPRQHLLYQIRPQLPPPMLSYHSYQLQPFPQNLIRPPFHPH